MTEVFPYFLWYAALGCVAGTIAGLLGVGGGLIIVPALSYLFELQGIAPQSTLHLALGTSLGTIVFTSLSSTAAHHRRNAVGWGIFARIAPGILVGSYWGGLLASNMVTHSLKGIFSVFLLLVAVQMLSGARPRPTRTFPGPLGSTLVGTGIGTIAGLVGIGGGSMSVPFMIWCNIDMRKAVGTSAAIGFPIAVAGALSYAINGLRHPLQASHTFGFIHLPALLGISIFSVLMAPLGARLASVMPPPKIKRWFAVLLFLVSLKMLWSVVG